MYTFVGSDVAGASLIIYGKKVPNAADFFQQVQDLIAMAIPGTNAWVIRFPCFGFWLPAIPPWEKQNIVELALEHPDKPPRELAIVDTSASPCIP
jgi:hypothetical protein